MTGAWWPSLLTTLLPRRTLLRRGGRWALVAGGAGSAGLAYAAGVEPRWVDLQPVTLALPRLSPRLDGYRVVQLSDLHLGDWLDHAGLAAVVALVNRQQPDLIAITGDIVTRRPATVAADLVDLLGRLRARDGVVAVLGNHDHWSDPALLREVLHAGGIVELANAVHTVERDGVPLHLAGVDDVWERRARLDQVLDRLPAAGAAILLVHEPDFADASAVAGRFDLQLSGHSHGGQVILPLIGPPVLPWLGRKYPLGRYQVGRMVQYTNRGVGSISFQSRYLGRVRPHLRFNCRPEVTLLTLTATPTAAAARSRPRPPGGGSPRAPSARRSAAAASAPRPPTTRAPDRAMPRRWRR